MLIEFSKIDEVRNNKFKGGNGDTIMRLFCDGLNKVMMGLLQPGCSIGMHTHEIDSEVIYILSGKGIVLYDETSETLAEGSCHYCPKGHSHSLINDGDEDLIFLAVVPQHGE